MPGMGSSVTDATLSDTKRSALVLASVKRNNPARQVMTRVAPDVAPPLRTVRQSPPDLGQRARGAAAPQFQLRDPGARTPSRRVDLSRPHAAWLARFAPDGSPRPTARPAQAGATLSTSGAIAAPSALVFGDALRASVVPAARPAGLSRRLVRYSGDWLRRVALREPSAEQDCFATAIYHEARGETLKGQFAVAEVILNRVESDTFPDTICNVVFEGVTAGRRGGCQFSFACDGKSDAMRNRSAADRARRIAQVMADGGHRGLTKGAQYFHTTGVSPSWSRQFTKTAQIGVHLFYRG